MGTDVSVLMTVYNGARFVQDAVNSVLAETSLSLQLVIVDDGSTDATPGILQAAAQKDPRVQMLRLERNLGLPAAPNLGLPLCTGKYIARLDADDLSLPGRFQIQRDALENGHRIGFVGSSARRINAEGVALGKYHAAPLEHDAIVQRLRSMEPFCPHSSFFAPRTVFERLKGYSAHRSRSLDYDFMLRLSECPDLRFAFIPDPLIALRMHASSISYEKSSGRDQLIQAVSALAEHFMRLNGSKPPASSVTHAEVERVLSEKGILAAAEARRRLIVARMSMPHAPLRSIVRAGGELANRPLLLFQLPKLNALKTGVARTVADTLK